MAAFVTARAAADSLLVVGVEPRELHGEIAAGLPDWGRQFTTEDPSPLQMVVHRSRDGVDRVFVAQQTPDHLRQLLQAWNIDRAKAERRAYARLKDGALEALLQRF